MWQSKGIHECSSALVGLLQGISSLEEKKKIRAIYDGTQYACREKKHKVLKEK
jgi:hypothetical protein